MSFRRSLTTLAKAGNISRRAKTLLVGRTNRARSLRVEPLENRYLLAMASGPDFVYTDDADFGQGMLVSVNSDAPNNDQLQLNEYAEPFPYINVAASARGTVVRINTDTGEIVGEYRTAPDGREKNPSRTTVDLFGNVWVGNRNEADGGSGSVTKIGLIFGGTRGDKNPDGSFTPNPSGEYLQGPFEYSTCVDRDGDGLIHTSTGLGSILSWNNAGGADDNGGVSTAQDECIVNYVRTAATNVRTVAIDENNDVWVGGTGNREHELIDGETGIPLPGTQFNLGTGGYGGLVDGNGVLWSANGLIRYDTNTMTGTTIALPNGRTSYGLALDNDGNVWNTNYSWNTVTKIAPDGSILGVFPTGGGNGDRGVAVTPADNHIWVANSGGSDVSRLDNNGNLLKVIDVGAAPTGVSVDREGKTWVTNLSSNTVSRIDPNAGGDGLGAVDLTVDLGVGAGPYNYSDMTGFGVLGTFPLGIWSIVQDSGIPGAEWFTIDWNNEPEGNVPPGASLVVEARASDSQSGLGGESFIDVSNGVPFSLTGQYIDVRATFRPNEEGESPVLSDLRINPLDPDQFEPNDSIQWATVLGSLPKITLRDLTIHNTEDVDYFQITAPDTGMLAINAFFVDIYGDIDIRVLDADGNEIAVSKSTSDNEQISIPVVGQERYFLEVYGFGGATNAYDLEIESFSAPVPNAVVLDPADDRGISNSDNLTSEDEARIFIEADLNDFASEGIDILSPTEVIDAEPGAAVQVFVNGSEVGYADPIPGTNVTLFQFTFAPGDLSTTFIPADGGGGMNFVKAAVQIFDGCEPQNDARTHLSEPLLVTLDMTPPAPPTLAIDPAATDTGVEGQPETFVDRATSDTASGFLGEAEANATVRLYVDSNRNLAIDLAGLHAVTQVVPIGGTGGSASVGQWNTAFIRDLNDPTFFPLDGVREVAATAEDVAGNVSEPGFLDVSIDTQGPQVTAVYIQDAPEFGLLAAKPMQYMPTPLVDRLAIDVRDLPNRSDVDANFLYNALVEAVAETPGHYSLVGDYSGVIPVAGVDFLPNPVVPGSPATGTIILEFAEPLPDDRFTLTVSDSLVDPVGNALDGESNIAQPLLPGGDGVPGGDFVVRFTVDSRPEVGTWAAGSVYVDTNGNWQFDPANTDAANRDVAYVFGFASDYIFAGNFQSQMAQRPLDGVDSQDEVVYLPADGFDKLAAYGKTNEKFRWLIDTDNNGVLNLMIEDPANIIGQPVAGNFDGSAYTGDEVGLFTGSTWYFDTDHDFRINLASAVPSAIQGYPIVGDFDGDGIDDLAAWREYTVSFDLAFNGFGQLDATIEAGFIGTRERPVAADMDMDGIDDVGLWTPDRSGATPEEGGEWFFLISNDPDATRRQTGTVVTLDHAFSPIPLGDDLFARFGDEFALPVVGNFDPPPAGQDLATGPTIVNLIGTAGNDLFEVAQGDLPGTWVVKHNGAVQDILSGTDAVVCNGMGGHDTVLLETLSAGSNDTAEVWPDHGVFTSDGVTFTLTDVDSISINAGAGEDAAIVHDSPGDDSLVARAVTNIQPVSWITVADYSEVRGFVPSYSHALAGFENLTGYSTGGVDVASFYDSDGDDTLVAKESVTVLSGPGFNFQAENFQYTHGYAKAGGNDLAELYDTPRNDRFKASPTYAKMFKGFFQRRAKFFETVEAYAMAGGTDDARLFDSNHGDQFIASPSESRLFSTTAGYDIKVMAFDRVLARAGSGFDTATFSGGPGDDLLLHKWINREMMAKSPKTELMDRATKGGVYQVTARRFNYTTAIGGQGGYDVAKFWDSLDDDRFTVDGDTAAMYDSNNELLYDAVAFNQVVFNHVNGGSNKTEKGAAINFLLSEYWLP